MIKGCPLDVRQKKRCYRHIKAHAVEKTGGGFTVVSKPTRCRHGSIIAGVSKPCDRAKQVNFKQALKES